MNQMAFAGMSNTHRRAHNRRLVPSTLSRAHTHGQARTIDELLKRKRQWIAGAKEESVCAQMSKEKVSSCEELKKEEETTEA